MTNHVHFVAVPEREDSLALLFGRANGRYAQALNSRKGRSGHLWQAPFHSCPLSDSHLEVALRYVEENPCRAGMAASPAGCRWSSAAAHLLGVADRSGVLAGHPLGRSCSAAKAAPLRCWRCENARIRGSRSEKNRLLQRWRSLLVRRRRIGVQRHWTLRAVAGSARLH